MAVDDESYDNLHAWAELLDVSTYYELLGVLEIADERAIKDAFHQFAVAFHPDRHDPELKAVAQRVFQRGAEAYRVLMSSELRARYDMALARGMLRLGVDDAAPRLAAGAADRVKSLDELCRSSAAKLCARKADDLIGEGDLAGAKRELKMALYHDDNDNPELEERLDGLEMALFAQGD